MSYRMSREIGGDCVDAFTLPDGRVALMVGDVSGKGIAAALVMSGVQAQFRLLGEMGSGLADIAARIEQHLLDRANGRYVTAVLIFLDTATGTFDYLSAGHVSFVYVESSGDPVEIAATGPPMGLLPGMPAQSAVDVLLADSDRFAGGIAADDDLTVVVVRATP